MSKYKLIISDYDGTLAGKDHIISKKTISAIKKWLEKGKKFTIASGRQYLMLKKQIDILKIDTPVITRGGSEIVDPKTGDIIYSRNINIITLQEFMQLVEKRGFIISIEKGNKIYSNYYRKPEFEDVIEFVNLDKFTISEIPKMVIFALKDIDEKAKFVEEDLIKKFPELHIVEIFPGEGRAWDITSTEATKHMMVLELIKILGLKREEVVGVGNGYNDFPLLEACGFKVAMGDAVEELKEIADLVVPNYQENGVAVLIKKLLSNN